jgi:hypothetical protein
LPSEISDKNKINEVAHMNHASRTGTLVMCMLFSGSVHAQELEPRSLTNIPVGMNFGVVGYAWTNGNILLDPALPIEDLNANVHGIVAAYVPSINIFGKSGKIDALLPFASGNWSGTVSQQYQETARNGFGDPKIRLSVNLLGAPALNIEDYKSYQQKTILGINMQVSLPIGQYFLDQLINLGSNRFTFRPQVGMSHLIENWIVEGYASIWLFTRNNDFYGGNDLRQDPIYTVKLHLIRSLPKGIWLAADAGYANGGIAFINEVERESHISTFHLGGTLSLPLGLHHTLKFFGFTTFRLDKGSDYDLLSLAYQFRWISDKN